MGDHRLMSEIIDRQGSSYRQGLVLGLTMAEIMLLLVFCLLIAMATILGTEQTKLAETQQMLDKQRALNERDTASIAALRQDTALVDKLSAAGGSGPSARRCARTRHWSPRYRPLPARTLRRPTSTGAIWSRARRP